MNLSPDDMMRIDADLKLVEGGLEQLDCDPVNTLAVVEAWNAFKHAAR
jgi:hypothetical protein